MNIDAISIGDNPPEDINVIIEVPIGGEPIKYEMNKKAGALFVDRFLYTPMRYPGNYGFVPHTLSDDGDPIDVLVANSRPIAPGAVINVRPIGVLKMDDEGGGDEKIIAADAETDDALCPCHRHRRHAENYNGADPAFLRALQGSGAG
jgi:inorganic pyrophosphatase